MNAIEPANKCQPSDATVRALKRVDAGERPTLAAKAEGIHPSTLFRALSKLRPHRLFLIITKERGGFNAWIENENYKQQGSDTQLATVAELQATLPNLLARC